jgi:hypothetical protein
LPFAEITTILLIAKGCHQNGDFSKDAILEINIEFQSIKIQEVSDEPSCVDGEYES